MTTADIIIYKTLYEILNIISFTNENIVPILQGEKKM